MNLKKLLLPVGALASVSSAQVFALATPLISVDTTDQLTQITTDMGTVGLALVGVAALSAGIGWVIARII